MLQLLTADIMVYTTVKIVLGVIITENELSKLLELESNDDIIEYDVESMFNGDIGDAYGTKLYPFPCCSNFAGKLFIVGKKVNKYYRKPIRCDDCPKYCVCDRCIGHTNNGYYDVISMLNGPTEVNIRHMCLRCFHDNLEDLNGPLKTANLVDNCFVSTDYDQCLRKHCSVCNDMPNEYRCPQDSMEFFRKKKYEKLKAFVSDNGYQKEIKFYYVIDDCLSCS